MKCWCGQVINNEPNWYRAWRELDPAPELEEGSK